MDDTVIRRRVVVHGRVQGVFFRDSCRQTAAAEGVTGWVSNEPNGTVLAVSEDPPTPYDAWSSGVAAALHPHGSPPST